jgi:hypothetical protein
MLVTDQVLLNESKYLQLCGVQFDKSQQLP